jgi:regulator of RNase E activity RraA
VVGDRDGCIVIPAHLAAAGEVTVDEDFAAERAAARAARAER